VIDARNSFVALDRSFADGPRVKPIHEAFLAQTKRLYLDALAGKATFDRETSPYGGAASCRACHAKEFAVWEKSAHARAWAGLQRVGKTFDPECIECHVVGWRQPGGFRSEADSPQLAAVGCEVCHGPGKAHIRAAGKERGGLERSSLRRCQTCHNPERAPAFDPDRGWRQIAH
jgi:cytochrome c553